MDIITAEVQDKVVSNCSRRPPACKESRQSKFPVPLACVHRTSEHQKNQTRKSALIAVGKPGYCWALADRSVLVTLPLIPNPPKR